ncbi:carbohydrate kinase family protein [Pseudohalioglobus lutimaris]|uniref:Fructokinase n=1 Tax=Pseudohalioglobus lutimaris TaxID=1737061 RepID=A0A2N5X5B4_9GAMM|nr:carbohydrate kinase [Pseudohalioglobus lutimaris]PLW69668.1 fructokinase [Pseudohalioglobus lutimaris]
MKIAVLGEALIDFIAGDDGAYRPHLGGSPYNVSIGLARQGIDVSYLCSLSDDRFGDQLRESLLGEGVNLPLQRRSLWPTSLALVTLNREGHPSYRLYREGIADKDTSYEEIVANLPESLRVFHTGSLAITPSQLPKIRNVFDFLRERGVLISIDINIRIRASIDRQRYLDGVRSLLKSADIIKASDEDLMALGLSGDTRRSAELVYEEMNGGVLVLTEGGGGAVVYSNSGRVAQGSYRVPNVVDTVGAGDTFHSAFLAYLSRSGDLLNELAEIPVKSLGTALKFACAAAAINVSRAGCSPPTHEEVSEYMAAAEPE